MPPDVDASFFRAGLSFLEVVAHDRIILDRLLNPRRDPESNLPPIPDFGFLNPAPTNQRLGHFARDRHLANQFAAPLSLPPVIVATRLGAAALF
jgi:hypothetical protein